MLYTLINLIFLIPAVVLLYLAARAKRKPRTSWPALLVTAFALVILTIVFDNIMIAADLFHYDETHTSGVLIGLMPIEDLAYVVCAFLALPAAWDLLGRGRPSEGTERTA